MPTKKTPVTLPAFAVLDDVLARERRGLPTATTQTIAGHVFTLVPGKRYRASRPMLDHSGQARFDVTITELESGNDVAVVTRLQYDQANALLAAFNNGKISFEGRVWN